MNIYIPNTLFEDTVLLCFGYLICLHCGFLVKYSADSCKCWKWTVFSPRFPCPTSVNLQDGFYLVSRLFYID